MRPKSVLYPNQIWGISYHFHSWPWTVNERSSYFQPLAGYGHGSNYFHDKQCSFSVFFYWSGTSKCNFFKIIQFNKSGSFWAKLRKWSYFVALITPHPVLLIIDPGLNLKKLSPTNKSFFSSKVKRRQIAFDITNFHACIAFPEKNIEGFGRSGLHGHSERGQAYLHSCVSNGLGVVLFVDILWVE